MAGLVWPLRLIRRRDQLVEVVSSSQVFGRSTSFGIEVSLRMVATEYYLLRVFDLSCVD
jgi:hypothetical protein